MYNACIALLCILAIAYIFSFAIWWLFAPEYERCYCQMEKNGAATLGVCSGMMGGDKETEYLSYSCIDCPYFVKTIDGKEMGK